MKRVTGRGHAALAAPERGRARGDAEGRGRRGASGGTGGRGRGVGSVRGHITV